MDKTNPISYENLCSVAGMGAVKKVKTNKQVQQNSPYLDPMASTKKAPKKEEIKKEISDFNPLAL